MEIIKVNPQGFCKGVIRAINIINAVLEDENTKRPIFMYGGLVHNKHIINTYEKKGVIITNNLEDITSGSVIITAHGVSDKVLKTFADRNLQIINATCFDVLKSHSIIKEHLQKGYTIIFYGKANHPETKGILGISEKILLIEKKDDIKNLNINNPLLAFASQTTMSYFDTEDIYAILKLKFPHIIAFNDICQATKQRQLALIKIAKEVDLCIVVGDPMSNNSNKLKEVCEKYTNTPCIMIETISDLQDFAFTNINKIAITAGASTPTRIVDEVISGIKNKDFTSKLTDEDYLQYQKSTLK